MGNDVNDPYIPKDIYIYHVYIYAYIYAYIYIYFFIYIYMRYMFIVYMVKVYIHICIYQLYIHMYIHIKLHKVEREEGLDIPMLLYHAVATSSVANSCEAGVRLATISREGRKV